MRRKKKREEEGERKKFGVVMMIIIKDGRAQLAQRSTAQFVPHREITAIMTGGVRAKHGVALRSTCLRGT
ncbi:Pentafunctional AROM polypeptide [Fusarium oxysporum f. sp. albedinis]|nr:Pentafunctional AROM polypeptide [Fusarium oxysporum f. sp. albedinis]